MSIIYYHSGMRRTHEGLQTGIYRGIELFTTLWRWQARTRQRHDLEQLDPRLLEDVGLTAAQRAAELRKPCWRA